MGWTEIPSYHPNSQSFSAIIFLVIIFNVTVRGMDLKVIFYALLKKNNEIYTILNSVICQESK